MNADLRRKISDWIEFYHELGIEDFYFRRQSVKPAMVATPKPNQQIQDSGHLKASESDLASAPLVTPSSVAPTVFPAQTLNLFEAPSGRPAERELLPEILLDLGDCHRCRLAEGRHKIVFGEGNPHAELVFVGEGPGADEDAQGLPFVGRAGQLLNRMINLIGMKREDVYICNVVKCRPPGNRTPLPDEIETCSPFLFRQLAAIQPRLICCLGAPAVRTVLGIKEGITKIRGQFYTYGTAKALATVHPAYILRNPREERLLREDFEKIRAFLSSAPSHGSKPFR